MEKNNYSDSELIKLHNDGEIILLEQNSKTEDRFLFNLDTHKHLYKNQKGDKYYLCEIAPENEFDLAIICDAIEELKENETLQLKVFLPECLTELTILNVMSEQELFEFLMYEALENLALVKGLTGEGTQNLIEKYKNKAPDIKIRNL